MLMKIGQEIKNVLNGGNVCSCGIPIIEEVTIMRFYEAKSMADDNQIHALFKQFSSKNMIKFRFE
jgi:hypothetical protein